MKQRLQHAMVTEALRFITRDTLSKELDAALKDLTLPPNHRLHLLDRSIAWHENRKKPEPRLQELSRELARLWQGVENKQEQKLYLLLISNLGLRHELDALRSSLQQQETSRTLYQQVIDALQPAQQQASWTEQVVQRVQAANAETTRPYELSDEEITHVQPQIRLLLALAAVQLIQSARQRSTMWEMIKQRTETEQAA
jgi:hypothetical protein